MKTEEVIALLTPALQPLIRLHLARAKAAGLIVIVTSGFRTSAKQLELYAQGREWKGQWVLVDAGKIVTNALPHEGPHCRGAAYDLCPLIHERCAWDRNDLFAQLGALGEALGLVWGGHFTGKFKDRPHFELPAWRSLPYPPEAP